MLTLAQEKKIQHNLDFATAILFTTSIGIRFKSGAWVHLQALPGTCLDEAKTLSEQDGIEAVYLSPIGKSYDTWWWYAPAKKPRKTRRLSHKADRIGLKAVR